ncbi:CASP-like protein 4A1 isoform X1 [Jatropha curcas]|uniref:CASP-like protein 4A1 isoform X1 n=1 Tax=Jatropha curcas TaxID=180498 RepID=UPI001894B40D|nr:CASP-like protein 4A1 isoform X1 [Jatropha curcas]
MKSHENDRGQGQGQVQQHYDHENDQKQPPQEEEHPKQPHHLQELLEQEEEEERKEEELEQEEGENDTVSTSPPVSMHSSSPPPKPPPSKPPSPDSSGHHTSHDYDYVLSPPQLKEAKYQFPPPDQTSQTYVFSSSSPAKSPSPSPEPPRMPVSKTQDEDAVQKPVEVGIPGGRGGGSSRRKPSISEREKENMKNKALLGFRFLGLVFCLVSFSVMAADKNQGWAFDSFYRYKEFRYCMSINVMGFVYSGLQAYDLAYSLATGKHFGRNQLRYLLDFTIDQASPFLYVIVY